jgi:hypothetical protein
MKKHYSQQGSQIDVNVSDSGTLLHVCMQGFISTAMLRENCESWWKDVFAKYPIREILFDPSEVAGFDNEIPQLASELLLRTSREGVVRVAIISPSSVVRTTIQLLRPRLAVEIGCFIGLKRAQRWLEESRLGGSTTTSAAPAGATSETRPQPQQAA